MHISKLHKLLLHNCANIIFRLRVHIFFFPTDTFSRCGSRSHTRTTHSTHRLTGVHGSAHRLNNFVMHKLNRMIFFSMCILNLGSTNANNDCRAREEHARCACPRASNHRVTMPAAGTEFYEIAHIH